MGAVEIRVRRARDFRLVFNLSPQFKFGQVALLWNRISFRSVLRR